MPFSIYPLVGIFSASLTNRGKVPSVEGWMPLPAARAFLEDPLHQNDPNSAEKLLTSHFWVRPKQKDCFISELFLAAPIIEDLTKFVVGLVGQSLKDAHSFARLEWNVNSKDPLILKALAQFDVAKVYEGLSEERLQQVRDRELELLALLAALKNESAKQILFDRALNDHSVFVFLGRLSKVGHEWAERLMDNLVRDPSEEGFECWLLHMISAPPELREEMIALLEKLGLKKEIKAISYISGLGWNDDD